ncbi:MAG: hypothetical protein A3J76_00520 [Candidatus Moranbacteria bacterium RBG_13_45_13]|nr:MAG: hypothetical protein A3J76_00520 [Candidatus Moranbacteria bacterium RBG_13_45_13]
MEQDQFIRKSIGLLAEAFGLRPRLTKDEYDELRKHYDRRDYSSIIAVIKDRFGLSGFNIRTSYEKSKKFKDRFRLTWLDGIYDFFWQNSGKPKTRDFSSAICLISYHRDEDDPPDFKPYGQMKIWPWAKRLAFETTIFLVAVNIAWAWIYECEQARLFAQYRVNAELLALIAGFDYAAEYGRTVGRYDFSFLNDADFREAEWILKEEREHQGIAPVYS